MDPALRPDRCKIVMEHPGGEGKLFFYVDPDRVGNWRSRPVDWVINNVEAGGQVVSVATSGSRLLYASPNLSVDFTSAEEEMRRLESKG